MKTFFYLLLTSCPLWTIAQAELLIDLNPGSSNANPGFITVVGDAFYFRATNGQAPLSLFKSDGTAGGTSLLYTAPIISGVNPGPSYMYEFEGNLLFHNSNGQVNVVYITDGTQEGTFAATDPDGNQFGRLDHPFSNHGYHYQLGAPWKYRRIASGTFDDVLLTSPDYPDGITAVSAFQFRGCGDYFCFTANDSPHGHEPFYSDGSHDGTFRIDDINPGSQSSWPRHYTCLDGGVLFTAVTGKQQRSLYRWDGPGHSVEFIMEINSSADGFSSISGVASFYRMSNGIYLFTANDGEHGNELWRTDGTTAGTYMVKDIRPGDASAFTNLTAETSFVPVGDGSQVIFYANDGEHGREWHITDGTESGTTLLIDLSPGISGSYPGSDQYLALDGKVYFVGTRPGANRELFVTDGTEEGTVQLTDINPGGSSAITNVVHLNGTLYFRADHVDYGTEIWKLALETPASQEEQAIKNKFHIYPNPAKDFVRLEYQWGSESTAVQHNASLRITDVFGKQVHQARVALPHVLDVGFFAQGVYLVEFIINDERIVARLIVQ